METGNEIDPMDSTGMDESDLRHRKDVFRQSVVSDAEIARLSNRFFGCGLFVVFCLIMFIGATVR